MKNRYLIATMAASSLLLGACATNTPDSLVQLRQDMKALETSEQANRYAPVALQEAKDQLRVAESAWKKDKKPLYDHEYYLAERYVKIVEQESERGLLEEQLSMTGERRKAMLLSQREQELEKRAEEIAKAKEKAREAEEKISMLKNEMKNVKAENTDRGMVLTMSDVLFAFNSTELQPGGKMNIEKLAGFMSENSETKVTVEGFTDSKGSASYNKELSRERAQAVVNQLTSLGISKDRLDVKAYGEDFPVATNDTASGRQQNRRVQLVINDSEDHYKEPKVDEKGMQISSKL